MLQNQQKSENDWMFYTFCRENNPDNWRPGQPRRFAVRGFAEYKGRSTGNGWMIESRINWNDGLERHPSEDVQSQDSIIDDLKAEIKRIEAARG